MPLSRHQTDRKSSDGSGVLNQAPQLEVIACDGCKRCFATDDGVGMLALIKGPCPDCGGRFELLETRVHPGEL